MSERETEFEVRRLLLAVDTAGATVSTFAAAANLASRFGAELVGLFLEDTRLLRAATLSTSRYVSPLVRGGDLDLSSIEAELRALAARTRSALAVAASAAGVAWSFSVHRGEPSEEVGKIAGPGDIVVVGPGDHIVGPRPTTGHALVQAAAHASGSIVLGRARLHVARPLVLAQMESMLIERALAAAVRLVDPAHPEIGRAHV